MGLRESSNGSKSFKGVVGHLRWVEHFLNAEFAQRGFFGFAEVRGDHDGKMADTAFVHVGDEASDCGRISADPVTDEIDTFVASGFGRLFGALVAAEDDFEPGVAESSGYGPIRSGTDAVFAAQQEADRPRHRVFLVLGAPTGIRSKNPQLLGIRRRVRNGKVVFRAEFSS